MKLTITLALLALSTAQSNYLAWDYDLQSLPPGWASDPEWSFDSYGAKCYLNIYNYYYPRTSDLFSDEDDALITAGADSVVLDVASMADAQSWGYESYYGVRVYYRIDGGGWIELFTWTRTGFFEDYLPIHLKVPIATTPCTVGIRFEAVVYAGYPDTWSYINWYLSDLTLTVFSDLGLEQCTWGVIKASYPID